MKNETFESKIKPILLWMGTIVASVMAIAYIIVVFILIEGFKAEKLLNTSIFSIITALVGFCIMQMLKIQGQSFAANIEENKQISKQYNQTKTKDKKAHSMKYYWITSGAKDILVKCATLIITSIGMIYIMIEGSGDYNLLFLAGVNLLMFAGFGLISLVKTYDFYNDSYVPYMLERIKEAKSATNEEQKHKENKETTENENKESLEVVKSESTEQGNDLVHSDRRANLLEPNLDMCTTSSNSEPVVLDSSNSNDSILGGTIHSSNSVTSGTNSGSQKNS